MAETTIDPKLKAAQDKAYADGRSTLFVEKLTTEYHRRNAVPEKKLPTVTEGQKPTEIPTLKSVLDKAKADGKSGSYLVALERKYYERYGQEDRKGRPDISHLLAQLSDTPDIGINVPGKDGLPEYDPRYAPKTAQGLVQDSPIEVANYNAAEFTVEENLDKVNQALPELTRDDISVSPVDEFGTPTAYEERQEEITSVALYKDKRLNEQIIPGIIEEISQDKSFLTERSNLITSYGLDPNDPKPKTEAQQKELNNGLLELLNKRLVAKLPDNAEFQTVATQYGINASNITNETRYGLEVPLLFRNNAIGRGLGKFWINSVAPTGLRLDLGLTEENKEGAEKSLERMNNLTPEEVNQIEGGEEGVKLLKEYYASVVKNKDEEIDENIRSLIQYEKLSQALPHLKLADGVNASEFTEALFEQLPRMAIDLFSFGGFSGTEIAAQSMWDQAQRITTEKYGEDYTFAQLKQTIEDDEANLYAALGSGITTAALERFALGKVARATPGVKNLKFLKNTVKAARSPATASLIKGEFKQFIKALPDNAHATSGAFFAEANTEFVQYFTEETWTAYGSNTNAKYDFNEAYESWLQGGVVGGGLPTVGRVARQAKVEFKASLKKLSAVGLKGTEKYLSVLEANIRKQVELGSITETEGNDKIADIQSFRDANSQVPDSIKDEKRRDAINAILELQKIKEETAGLNPAFTTKQKEREKALKNKLLALQGIPVEGEIAPSEKTETVKTETAPKKPAREVERFDAIIEGKEISRNDALEKVRNIMANLIPDAEAAANENITSQDTRQQELYETLSVEDQAIVDKQPKDKRLKVINSLSKNTSIKERHAAEDAIRSEDKATRIAAARKLKEGKPFNAAEIASVNKALAEIKEGGLLDSYADEINKYEALDQEGTVKEQLQPEWNRLLELQNRLQAGNPRIEQSETPFGGPNTFESDGKYYRVVGKETRAYDDNRQSRKEELDAFEKKQKKEWKAENKPLSELKGEIDAILTNLKLIRNESNFIYVQDFIGSTSEAQDDNHPASLFRKGRRTPSQTNISRWLERGNEGWEANHLKLRNLFLRESSLSRETKWGSGTIDVLFQGLTEQSALGEQINISKEKTTAYGFYKFDTSSQGVIRYNDKTTTPDTILHEAQHLLDQYNIAFRPELAEKITEITKGDVIYEYTKKLMNGTDEYVLLRSPEGYAHEAKSQLLGRESVRWLETWDEINNKPIPLTKETLREKLTEVSIHVDAFESVDDIKTKRDAAAVLIYEVFTGRDAITYEVLDFKGRNIAASKAAIKTMNLEDRLEEHKEKKKEIEKKKEEVLREGLKQVAKDHRLDLNNPAHLAQAKVLQRVLGNKFLNQNLKKATFKVENTAGNRQATRRELVMDALGQHHAEFMKDFAKVEAVTEKVEYKAKPFKELKGDPDSVITTQEEQKEAKEKIMSAIVEARKLPETKQGALTLLNEFTDEEIYSRLAHVAQDFEDGDGVAYASFLTGENVFPSIEKLMKSDKYNDKLGSNSVKGTQGTLGVFTLQMLVDAGFIEFDRGYGGRDPNVITIDNKKLIENPRLFTAFIQGADPVKVIKHLPQGKLPYFEGEDTNPYWTKNKEDGMFIIGGKATKEALAKTIPDGDTKKVYEQAEKASKPVLLVNDRISSVYTHLLRKNAFTFKDKNIPESIRKSKQRKAANLVRYSVEVLGDKGYRQRTVFELRGRMRSALREMNHQGDKMGLSMVTLKNGSVIGDTGLQDMMIQASDTFGYKGQDFDERYAYSSSQFHEWMQWAADPIKYYDKIWSAKEPWMFFATINALHDAATWSKQTGQPITSFTSTSLVGWDQTASGPSIIGTMMQDHDNADVFNLHDGQEKGDPYTQVGEEFLKSKQGKWTESDVNQSLEVAKKIGDFEAILEKGKMTKEAFKKVVEDKNDYIKSIGKKRMAELGDAFFSRPELLDKFGRTFGKVLGRSKYYGGKVMGFKNALIAEFLPEKDYFPGFPETWALSAATELNKSVDEKFKRNTSYLNGMSKMGAELADHLEINGPVNGFVAINEPKKVKKGRVKEKNYRGNNPRISKKISLDYQENTNETDVARARIQGPSFLTHFSDAQLNAWIVLNFKQEGVYIFDNFLTTPGHSRELLNLVGKGYKEVFGIDYIKGLVKDAYKNAGKQESDAQALIDQLDFGTLDLTALDEITYHLFAAGNGLVRATPFPGRAQTILENKEAQIAIEEATNLSIVDKTKDVEEISKNCK